MMYGMGNEKKRKGLKRWRKKEERKKNGERDLPVFYLFTL